MTAGKPPELLLRVADELCAELGYGGGEDEVPGADRAAGDGEGMWGVLAPDDESLALEIRRRLVRIAAALGPSETEDVNELAVWAALNGVEMAIRGELLSGNGDQLASLMPSFIFLVAVPIVGQDRALQLTRRTSELIEQAPGG